MSEFDEIGQFIDLTNCLAAVMTRDGLNLVSTATPLPSQKDRDHDLYHIGCARRKTR